MTKIHVYDMEEFTKGFKAIISENAPYLKSAKVVIKTVLNEAGDKVALIPVPQLEFWSDEDKVRAVTKIPGMTPITTIVDVPKKKIH